MGVSDTAVERLRLVQALGDAVQYHDWEWETRDGEYKSDIPTFAWCEYCGRQETFLLSLRLILLLWLASKWSSKSKNHRLLDSATISSEVLHHKVNYTNITALLLLKEQSSAIRRHMMPKYTYIKYVSKQWIPESLENQRMDIWIVLANEPWRSELGMSDTLHAIKKAEYFTAKFEHNFSILVILLITYHLIPFYIEIPWAQCQR
jgi:hypothetical protein